MRSYTFTTVNAWKRLLAFTIDFLICFCIYLLLVYCFIAYADKGMVQFLLQNIVVFFASTFLIFVFLVFKDIFLGRSIGKALTGLHIVHVESSSKVAKKYLILRNIGTLVWPLELVFWSFNPNKAKIGGIKTQTRVVQEAPSSSSLPGFIALSILIVSMLYCGRILNVEALKQSEPFHFALQELSKDKEIYLKAGNLEDFRLLKGFAGISEARFVLTANKTDHNYKLYVYLIKMDSNQWEVANVDLVEK
ncbi:RDD family protein [Myroides sp. LJL115]